MPTSKPLALLPHLGPFVTQITAGGQIWWTSDAELVSLKTYSVTPTQFILTFKKPLFSDVLLVTPLARSQGVYTHTAVITGSGGVQLSVDVFKEGANGRFALANAGLSVVRFTPGKATAKAPDKPVKIARGYKPPK